MRHTVLRQINSFKLTQCESVSKQDHTHRDDLKKYTITHNCKTEKALSNIILKIEMRYFLHKSLASYL